MEKYPIALVCCLALVGMCMTTFKHSKPEGIVSFVSFGLSILFSFLAVIILLCWGQALGIIYLMMYSK